MFAMIANKNSKKAKGSGLMVTPPNKDAMKLLVKSGENDSDSPFVNPKYAAPGEPSANPII